ncbi:MAG: glycoside hydrolase family 140 protein [Bryobacteraceae bacterium]|nr:glycoside hydrolase family 140 protein [Bryobacteraceae bacterium]
MFRSIRRFGKLTCSSLLLAFSAQASAEWSVAPDGRHLLRNGKATFWLADTGWELFRRLDRAQTEKYFRARAAQGFNVILASAFSEFSGRNEPNAFGQRPFRVEGDPLTYNEAYAAHVDWVIGKANEFGLTVALLPAWGDKVFERPGNPNSILNATNARAYGLQIGKSFGRHRNLVWVMGGDRNASGYETVWRELAAGIKAGESTRHLMTFHPNGRHSSSIWFQEDPWLDFNMLQSGHNLRDNPVHEMIRGDYTRKPVKPVLDGEPAYETHPVDWKAELKGTFTALDVRKHAYWATFAGAAGHTYGAQGVWGFDGWEAKLELPGATQLGYLRRLLEGRALAPAQGLLASGQGFGGEYVAIAAGPGGALVYTAGAPAYTLRVGRMPFRAKQAAWWNPRTGARDTTPVTLSTAPMQEFRPPSNEDWVLEVLP